MSQLISCIGYSLRLARKNGQTDVVPCLQYILLALVNSATPKLEAAAEGCHADTRRRIYLFAALQLDGSGHKEDAVGSESVAACGQEAEALRKSVVDCGSQTVDNIVTEKECTSMVEQIFAKTQESIAKLTERLQQCEMREPGLTAVMPCEHVFAAKGDVERTVGPDCLAMTATSGAPGDTPVSCDHSASRSLPAFLGTSR